MPFQPFAPDWDRAGWSGNEQWKWLAVEIAEIRRCAAVGDQAHNRLALLLVDHLVEVIVSREVNARLAMQPADSVIDELREIRTGGRAPDPELNKLIDEHVGPEQRRWLDQHLHEKTKYLLKHGVLTFEEREVLSRMHEYRNAAYHRDTLEADLISDLVLAHMMLAGASDSSLPLSTTRSPGMPTTSRPGRPGLPLTFRLSRESPGPRAKYQTRSRGSCHGVVVAWE
jgi:hypothetical protein